MASGGRSRVIGNYIVGKQIGSGSFSVVWHGIHRVHGTEVAIKEIIMERLNKKLQDSLMSEIDILKGVDHPNIVRLHEIIQVPGRILLVLEYCEGGDLSMYIQRHGSVPEATAKYFMQQLASGLQVLRKNNLIHRDLKPQNLLLSTHGNNSILKIADFGFARSLQPRGLAETLCGSPLYMAPEIMQLQKYDAKADLWSVGAILFQLVTGKPPFCGNNPIQLLQNIMKSNDLRFPSDKGNLSIDCLDLCQKLLQRNPVERLTFEEFFNHSFLCHTVEDRSLRRLSPLARDCLPLGEQNLGRNTEETSQDDCLHFFLDDDSNGFAKSPSSSSKRDSNLLNFGFPVEKDVGKKGTSSFSNRMTVVSSSSSVQRMETDAPKHSCHRTSDGLLKELMQATDQRLPEPPNKAVDSLELDQDYVLVSGPLIELSSSSASASGSRNSPYKLGSSPTTFLSNNMLSRPMPIAGKVVKYSGFGSLGSQSSAPSGTSQGSMDMGDVLEQPSTDSITRIGSLQNCASTISELVNQKIEAGSKLEAFSIQLVILAIWKQALHICHMQAASATSRSPSQIEREFLVEVGHAEELSRVLEPVDGCSEMPTEMPDAMETIFQSALMFGRNGAVDELMGNTESAVSLYSKAVCLLFFLLVEAPSLMLNPPFSLTNSDRFRLRRYIDILSNRQSHSQSQRLAVLKCEDRQSL